MAKAVKAPPKAAPKPGAKPGTRSIYEQSGAAAVSPAFPQTEAGFSEWYAAQPVGMFNDYGEAKQAFFDPNGSYFQYRAPAQEFDLDGATQHVGGEWRDAPEDATVADVVADVLQTQGVVAGTSSLASMAKEGYFNRLRGWSPEVADEIGRLIEELQHKVNPHGTGTSPQDDMQMLSILAAPLLAMGGLEAASMAGEAFPKVAAAPGIAGLSTVGAGLGGIQGFTAGGDLADIGEGMLTGGVAGAAAGVTGNPFSAFGAGQAVQSGAVNPEDLLRSLANQYATSGLFDVAAPHVAGAFDDLLTADAGEAVPLYSTPATTAYDAQGLPLKSTPAMTTMGSPGGMLRFSEPTSMLPGGALASALSAEELLDQADAENRATLEAGDELPTTETAPTTDYSRYARLANTISQMLGSDSPESAPAREEGQTDEEYAGELAEYLSLDAQAMADAGLQPGTPEYYEYIMAQADAIIAQNIGDDFDLSAEDLSAQLRDKTEAEMLALQRALFVRGQIEILMGSGTYIDPATGEGEEVIGEGMFDPNTGAYQRGLAGDVDELGGLQGQGAYDFLSRLLGRNVDFFGMESAAQQRAEAARRAPKDDEERRRRGMFSSY